MKKNRSLPLTGVQQAMLADQLIASEESGALSLGAHCIVQHVLDPEILERAYGMAVRRHETTSSHLVIRNGEAVLEPQEQIVPVFTVEHLTAGENVAEAIALSGGKLLQNPRGVFETPLCRVHVLYPGDGTTHLFLVLHHLISDGWSTLEMIDDFGCCYSHVANGTPLSDAVPFSEFLVESETYRVSETYARDDQFWKGYLQGLEVRPLAEVEVLGVTETGIEQRVIIPAEVYDHFKQTCCSGGSLTGPFLAVFLLELAAWTGKQDIAVALPYLNRRSKRSRRVVGNCMNLVPLRFRVDAAEPFLSMVQRVERELRTVMRHGRYPDVFTNRFPNGHALRPLIQCSFSHLTRRVDTFAGFEMTVGYMDNPEHRKVFVGNLLDIRSSGDVEFKLDSSSLYCSGAELDVFLQRMLGVMRSAADRPEQTCRTLMALLPAEETGMEPEMGPQMTVPDLCIHQVFEACADAAPEAPALSGPGCSWTYGELDAAANRMAHALRSKGLRQGDVVGVVTGRHAHLSICILGIWKAGGVYLPLDAALPEVRLQAMVRDADVKLFIVLADMAALSFLPEGDRSCVVSLAETEMFPPHRPACLTKTAECAYIIFTSGSTGVPKGVAIAHAGFVNMIIGQARVVGVQPSDRLLAFASPSFDASLSEMFLALTTGASLHPVSRSVIDDLEAFVAFMEEHSITGCTIPPTYLRLLRKREFLHLRFIITAGEPPVREDAMYYASRLHYFNAYGPTENSVCATVARILPDGEYGPNLPIGYPLPNMGAHVLDRDLTPVEHGREGELCLSGSSLGIGYINRPDLNETSFTRCGALDGRRIYRTGDRVRRNDRGELEYLGRIGREVKIRGYRIDPGEIENALAAHPEILQSVVLPHHVDGGTVLHCFISMDGKRPMPSPVVLRAWLLRTLPDYMVPAGWTQVTKIPLTRSAKVDQKALLVMLDQSGGTSVSDTEKTHCATSDSGIVSAYGESLASQEHSQVLPMSLSQRQFWILHHTEPSAAANNMPLILDAFTVNDVADVAMEDRLQGVINELICRHETLRTSFSAEEGQPVQCIAHRLCYEIERIDLRERISPAHDAEALCMELLRRPVDISCAPAFNCVIMRLPDRVRLALSFHHIIGDGQSIASITNDIESLLAGRAPLELRAQYQDFMRFEQEYLTSEALERDRAYWLQKLKDAPPRANIATDFPRQAFRRGRGEILDIEIGADALQHLSCRDTNAGTLFMRIVACVAMVLRQRADGDRITLGIPVSIRNNPEFYNVIGNFIVPQVLNLTVRHGDRFIDTLGQAMEAVIGAIQHGMYPSIMLHKDLQILRDPARGALFDVMVTTPQLTLEAAGVERRLDSQLNFVSLYSGLSKFDLNFMPITMPDGSMRIVLEYDPDLFSRSTARALLKELESMIQDERDCSRSVTHADALPHASGPVKAYPESAGSVSGTITEEPQARAVVAQETAPAVSGNVGRKCTEEAIRTMLNVWRTVLGNPTLKADDNYFSVGGDSIKAISLCGELRKHGILLSPAQIFRFPTVREAVECMSDAEVPEKHAEAQWPAAVSPIVHMFLNRKPEFLRYFTQVSMMDMPVDIDMERLQAAFNAVVEHHPAFRFRLENEQAPVFSLTQTPLVRWEHRKCASAELEAEARSMGLAFREWIDPYKGQNTALCLFSTPRKTSLLIVIAHTSVDAVSWRVLGDDLETAYRNGPAALVSGSAGFDAWTRALTDRLNSPALDAELVYWQNMVAGTHVTVPGSASADRWRFVYTTMDADAVSGLEMLVSRNHLDMRSMLLATLGRSLAGKLNGTSVLLYIEGHGRQVSYSTLDITRTMGWFTAAYPFRLDLHGDGSLAMDAEMIQTRMEQVPDGGTGFGLLCHVQKRIPMPETVISFNYHGMESSKAESLFSPSEQTPDLLSDMMFSGVSDPVNLTLVIVDGVLHISSQFAEELFSTEWMERMLEDWKKQLEVLASAQRYGVSGQVTALAPELPSGQPARPPVRPSTDQAESMPHQSISKPSGKMPSAGAPVRELPRTFVPEQVLPVTPSQAGMLFEFLSGRQEGTYALQLQFKVRGERCAELLPDIWRHVSCRHEALRATFFIDPDAGPMQRIMPDAPHALLIADGSGLSPERQEEELQAMLDHELDRGFRLDGPLMRASFYRHEADCCTMTWTFHHLLMDGWCSGILLNDIREMFAARQAGGYAALPPATTLKVMLDSIVSTDRPGGLAYWREYLAEFPSVSHMPHDGAGKVREYDLQERTIMLSEEETQAFAALASGSRVTVGALIHAAWALFLARHCGQSDVVFATISSGRPHDIAGAERAVGMFMQTLPARVRIEPDSPLAGIAGQIMRDMSERAPYEQIPLTEILQQCRMGNDLFNHVLIIENYPLDVPESALRLVSFKGHEQLPYDLGFSATPSRTLGFKFSFNALVFSVELMDRLAARWRMFMDIILRAPATPAAMITVARLDGTMDTALRGPQAPMHSLFPHRFIECAGRFSDSVALCAPGAGAAVSRKKARGSNDAWQDVSYGTLATRALAVARCIVDAGNGTLPVAVFMERGEHLLSALVGVMLSGAPYVPLDPLYPVDRIRHILKDSGARMVLVDKMSAGLLEELLISQNGSAPAVLRVDAIIPQADMFSLFVSLAATLPVPEDLAYIIYTSGSTGKPKGVAVTHANLINFLDSMADQPGITRDDSLLAVTTVCFDIAGLELYLPLLHGARVVLASRQQATDAAALARCLDEQAITLMQATPSTWRLLLEGGWQGREGLTMLTGGEALPRSLARELRARGKELWNLYGPTETTIWSSRLRVENRDLASGTTEGTGAYVSLGSPLHNTSFVVVDASLTPVPDGVAGELCIGGAGVARGYHDRPELNTDRFVFLSVLPGERMYRTGDRVILHPDHRLEYIERMDFQVKVRGYRIETGEVESRLEEMDAVRQAIVMPFVRGGDTVLGAWLCGEGIAGDSALRSALARTLPEYMIPAYIFRVDAMPLTPNGKVDRKGLVAQVTEGTTKHAAVTDSLAESGAAHGTENDAVQAVTPLHQTTDMSRQHRKECSVTDGNAADGVPQGMAGDRACAAEPAPSAASGRKARGADTVGDAAEGYSGALLSPDLAPDIVSGSVAGPAGATEAGISIAPATDTAVLATLTDLWSKLLGQSVLSEDDDFFRVGGHSILALRLMTNIQKYFDVQLSVQEIFHRPVLKDMASLITSRISA